VEVVEGLLRLPMPITLPSDVSENRSSWSIRKLAAWNQDRLTTPEPTNIDNIADYPVLESSNNRIPIRILHYLRIESIRTSVDDTLCLLRQNQNDPAENHRLGDDRTAPSRSWCSIL
jgi:hypothetical protein